jgi:hypothetical protein
MVLLLSPRPPFRCCPRTGKPRNPHSSFEPAVTLSFEPAVTLVRAPRPGRARAQLWHPVVAIPHLNEHAPSIGIAATAAQVAPLVSDARRTDCPSDPQPLGHRWLPGDLPEYLHRNARPPSTSAPYRAKSWRRRCSQPGSVTTSSQCVASRKTAVVIRPPRGPVNSRAMGSSSMAPSRISVSGRTSAISGTRRARFPLVPCRSALRAPALYGGELSMSRPEIDIHASQAVRVAGRPRRGMITPR